MIIPPNIGEFTLGRVVKRKSIDDYDPSHGSYVIGHVVGFRINYIGELIVVVQWASNDSKLWPGAFREKDLGLLFN